MSDWHETQETHRSTLDRYQQGSGWHGSVALSAAIDAALNHIAALEAALKALADDYEKLCGDGLTTDNEPGVLRDAREVLRRPR